jgi:perosamine synthetase
MAFVAPAGTPLQLTEIAAGLMHGARSSEPARALLVQLMKISAADFAWSLSSGRAAMVVALRAMRRLNETRTQVVMSGYTCYSVAAAAQRTGLQPVLCDVDPRTLSPDPDCLRRMDLSRVLAIISSNLYGIPNETAELERIAAQNGLFLLDDAAQSLGATVAGRAAGSFGDVGLFSFDKGKNIPTMQGGALVARRGPLVAVLAELWSELPAAGVRDTLMNAAKLAAFAVLLQPRRYGLVRSLPGVGLGQTPYELDYPITRYSDVLAGVGVRLATRLDSINAQRIENAAKLRAALQGVSTVQLIEPPESARPVYLRFPILAATAPLRNRLIAALEAAGIGATASYPRALADVPEVRVRLAEGAADTPGAREVAERIVTLPTHAYCPPEMAERVHDIVVRVAAG